MRKFKIVTLLVIGIFGFCKSYAQTDALKYADSLSKATGLTYMNMFGTKVFVPKPKGKSAVKRNINILEVYNDSAQVIAEINVLEMPAYAIVQLPAGEFTTLGIKGYAGKLYKKKNNEATVLTFFFEDDQSRVLIQVSFIGVDKRTEEEYIDLLKNVRYDKYVKIHTRLLPLLARFTIDAASAGYKLIDISKGAYRYSPNGITPASVSQPQMWITEHNITDISELRYLDIPAMPSGVRVDTTVKNVEEPTIDGFKVYTTVMYIGLAPNQLMVYQAARTNGLVSAVMTGIATSGFEKNLALFANMAKTFHVRGNEYIKLFDQ